MASKRRRTATGSGRSAKSQSKVAGSLYTAKVTSPKNPSAAFVDKLKQTGADPALIAAVRGQGK